MTVARGSVAGSAVRDPIFEATVQATEEAIVKAMVGAETMTGVDGHRGPGLPHDSPREILRKAGRVAP